MSLPAPKNGHMLYSPLCTSHRRCRLPPPLPLPPLRLVPPLQVQQVPPPLAPLVPPPLAPQVTQGSVVGLGSVVTQGSVVGLGSMVGQPLQGSTGLSSVVGLGLVLVVKPERRESCQLHPRPGSSPAPPLPSRLRPLVLCLLWAQLAAGPTACLATAVCGRVAV